MKRVAVFGASGAIGGAFVEQCSQKADAVYAFAQSLPQTNLPNVIYHQISYQNETSICESIDLIDGELDLIIIATGLLHTKAIQPERSLAEIIPENLLTLYHANTVVPALLIKHLQKKLDKQRLVKIAILSARVGSISDNRLGGWYAYRCAKAALNMFIKTASIELKRVNSNAIVFGLHPGTVDSSLSKPFQRHVPEGKLFTAKYSVTKLIEVILGLSAEDTGCCFAWDGQKIEP